MTELGLKYAVIRVDTSLSLPELRLSLESGAVLLDPAEYFVLRRSDMLAAPALWGYAHSIQSLIEAAASKPGILSDEETERLRALANGVADLAANWQTYTRRLPD